MFGIAGIAAAVVVAGIVGFAMRRPDSFYVERSTTIGASPETLFAIIDDFHRWPDWSPWEKIDPQMNRTHSGPARGKGAIYEWAGNKKVGAGRMEIIESEAPSRVRIKLDFLEPFEAHNIADLELEREGAGTRVTWALHGPCNFITKVMGVFVSMDKMVGKDFETGLANMKRIAES
jgi:hypothetical protein